MSRWKGTVVMMLAFVGLVLVGGRAPQAQPQGAKEPVLWPVGDIKWTDNPAMNGARMAALWGDPKKGGYGALKKIPGGTTLALHTHTHDQRVITITGTITLSIKGGPSKDMTAGSYAFIPGGVEHVAECKAGAECTYFEEQQGASDIKFVEKPAPKN